MTNQIIDAEPTQTPSTVVETATKSARTKTFLKKNFKTVGVPLLIGATAAIFVIRSSNNADSSLSDTDTDE